VAVTVGSTPIKESHLHGIVVRFVTVNSVGGEEAGEVEGEGKLTKLVNGVSSGTPSFMVESPPNKEGIAECTWRLGPSPGFQQVRAEMYICNVLAPEIPPIYFNASLPISFYYISGDGVKAPPGSEVELKVGVILGNELLTSGFKIRFLLMPGETVLLESEPDSQGTVSLMYPISVEPRQQVRAELLFLDNTKSNFPPIYFNVEPLENVTPVATGNNTGIAILPVPPNPPSFPLVFGPFQHFLRVKNPPTVLLGLPDIEGFGTAKEKIRLTEDSPDIVKRPFKPIDITTRFFYIKLYGADTGKKMALRWWAIPAEEQENQTGGLVVNERVPTIAFDRDVYNMEDRAVLTVSDLNLNVNNTSVGVFVTTKTSQGSVPVELPKTDPSSNVYSRTVKLALTRQPRELVVDGIGIPIGNFTTKLEVLAVYAYKDASGISQSAEGAAVITIPG